MSDEELTNLTNEDLRALINVAQNGRKERKQHKILSSIVIGVCVILIAAFILLIFEGYVGYRLTEHEEIQFKQGVEDFKTSVTRRFDECDTAKLHVLEVVNEKFDDYDREHEKAAKKVEDFRKEIRDFWHNMGDRLDNLTTRIDKIIDNKVSNEESSESSLAGPGDGSVSEN